MTGLQALGTGAHFVLACDMPRLQTPVLRLLWETWQMNMDKEAVVPELADGTEPLCALYTDSALPKLHRFLEEGGRSARKALRGLAVQPVDEITLRIADPALESFLNINTREEWQTLCPR